MSQLLGSFFRFITKPLVILHLILIFQWGLFLNITLEPYSLQVPDRTYVLLRGHLIYTSLIREGRDGAWKATITHTTRPTPAVYAHTFFIFLGKVAAILHVDPPMMYMATRMAAAVILFWSTYWFIRIILPPSLHAVALIFTLFLEPGPMLSTLSWNPNLWQPSIFSYYPQIVALRHFGLPHHTIGEAIGLLFLGTFILSVKNPKPARLLTLGLLGMIGTTILPPYFIIVCISVLLPWFLYSLLTKSWRGVLLPLCVAGLSVASVSLFLKYQFSLGYPWRDFNQDEKRWVTDTDVLISYVSTLLLYVPLVGLLWTTLLAVWRTWQPPLRRIIIIMTAWTLIPPALVPLSGYRWFPIANFRLMDGYNYVPAGILATLGLASLLTYAKKHAVIQVFAGFVLTGMIISSLFLTHLYTKKTIADQNNLWSNVYISNDNFKAFEFLKSVPKMSGLLISNHYGEIAPEYAPVRSFIGSTPGFVDWDERYYIMTSFYSGRLTNEEAKAILKREDIQYVYFGDGERSWNSTGTLYPDLLTPVFNTTQVTVYKVN